MRRAIRKLVHAEIPSAYRPSRGSGSLDQHDISAITEDALAVMKRAPRYLYLAYRFIFGFLGVLLNLPYQLDRCRRGDTILPLRRLLRKLAFGIMVPIQVAVYSSRKLLTLHGICDAGIKFGPPIKIVKPFPDIVETVEARSLSHKSEYDVIIIGSGPGGAVVAQSLAERGFSILVCEKGGTATPKVRNVVGAARRYYAYGGQIIAFGAGLQGVPVLTAEMVGGSAVVNMGTCLRPAENVMRRLAGNDPLLGMYFTLAEEALHVQPAEEHLMGRQNRFMAAACDKIGMRWEVIPRNAVNAGGAAVNLFGAAHSLKISPDRGALREAVAHGAVVARRAEVQRIVIENGRAVGVVAQCQGKRKTFTARKAVVVSGGSIQTPLLLKRSGLRHPGVGVAPFFQVDATAIGRMPEEKKVHSGVGIEQGIVCRDLENIGLVLEAVSLPAALIASYLPGDVEARWEDLRQFDRFAAIGFIADCSQTSITIDTLLGDPYLTFDLHHDDANLIRRGFVECAQLLKEAGAEEVLIPGLNRWFASVSEVDFALKATPDDDLAVASVHLVGTCSMGKDDDATVDPRGRVRGVNGLYVADGSVIPTALGVNPQLTIAALSLRTAVAIARDAKEK